jgi:hypothetical protein
MAGLSVIRRFPFTCYSLVATALIIAISITKPDYDGGTIGSFLVLTETIWAFPFWFAQEIGLPWFLGYVPCFFGDWLLARLRQSKIGNGGRSG